MDTPLALEPGQIDDSRSVLRDFGNMSSATILFVLRRILESTDDRAQSIAAIAFGPGLTIESALLERVPAHRGELSRSRRTCAVPA